MASLTKWDSKITRFETARALYECGKSFREIESEVYLPRSTLNRHAIKENWQKGKLVPFIQEQVRILLLLDSMPPEQRKSIEHAIEHAEMKRKRGWNYRYFCN